MRAYTNNIPNICFALVQVLGRSQVFCLFVQLFSIPPDDIGIGT